MVNLLLGGLTYRIIFLQTKFISLFMQTNKIIIILLVVSLSMTSYSQSQGTIDVNRDIDLVKVYIQVVNEGYGTVSIYKDLANEYYFRSDYSESKKWFEKLFSEEEPQEEILLYRYKQSLKALKLYTEDNVYLTNFENN